MTRADHDAKVAAEYERWSWGEGYQAGKVDGGRDGWRDGYTHGFDTGAEIDLEHAIGRERLQQMVRDADHQVPGADTYLDYRSRTTYEAPADRAEWRGLDNGAQLPDWDSAADDGMEL
jgi:hypothetical protein